MGRALVSAHTGGNNTEDSFTFPSVNKIELKNCNLTCAGTTALAEVL
jgi:hypothetical protein